MSTLKEITNKDFEARLKEWGFDKVAEQIELLNGDIAICWVCDGRIVRDFTIKNANLENAIYWATILTWETMKITNEFEYDVVCEIEPGDLTINLN